MEKFELRMQKEERERKRAEARADARTKARIDAVEKRLDKRMDSITKLLQHGMRMLAKTEKTLAELAEAQKATERTLKAFIDSSIHRRNGR